MGKAHLSGVGGGEVTISCEWEFHVAGTHSAKQLEAKGDRVMAALLDIESVDPRITDCAVSLDTANKVMTIGLVVSGTDYEETVAHSLTSIRAAIHAAGGSTPGWDVRESQLEPQGFRAAAV